MPGFADFGNHPGLAFQLVDDVLGIWGNEDSLAKPVLANLRARKKSAPVVAALDSGWTTYRYRSRSVPNCWQPPGSWPSGGTDDPFHVVDGKARLGAR